MHGEYIDDRQQNGLPNDGGIDGSPHIISESPINM